MDKTPVNQSQPEIDAHKQCLQKTAEFHSKEMKYKRNITSSIIICTLNVCLFLVLIILVGAALQHNGRNNAPEYPSAPLYCFFFSAKIAFTILSYFFVKHSLNILDTIFKEKWAEKIFLVSAFHKFSFELACIMALFLTYILPPCDDLIIPKFSFLKFLSNIFNINVADDPIDKRIIFSLLCVIFILSNRNMILFGLNFNVHYKYYINRINLSTEKVGLIKLINEKVNAAYGESIDLICERFFQSISKDGSSITQFDLAESLGEEHAEKIIRFCEVDQEDNAISIDDLKGLYFQALLDQQQILKSLDQNSTTVEEFKVILDIIFYPTALIYFIKSIDIFGSGKFVDYKLIAALLFSTSYSFSDTIKNFISSIHFIFFVRPYEIDDVIILEDKEYKVHAINLLTTVLSRQMKYTLFPHPFIASKPVTNLRLRKVWDEKYTFEFNLSAFESKKEELLSKLIVLMKKFPAEYKKKPYFTDMKILKDEKLSVTLVVGFNLDVADMDIIRDRKNTFLFRLNQILRSCDLIPFR